MQAILAVTVGVTRRGVDRKNAAFGALVAAFPNTGFMGVPLLGDAACVRPHCADARRHLAECQQRGAAGRALRCRQRPRAAHHQASTVLAFGTFTLAAWWAV
jgi:hypothetical protein